MNYLLWINIYLIVFYTFYWIFLRNTTFFQLRRFYLLTATLCSFILPSITFDRSFVEPMQETGGTVMLAAATIGQQMNLAVETTQQNRSASDVLAVLYLVGLLGSLTWLTARSIITRNAIRKNDKQSAFSFFNRIVVDPKIEGYDQILAHERVHANELHSIDVLLFEMIKIVNWFNPISYLMTRSAKLNHEYIADQKSVSTFSEDRMAYAHLLLSKALATDLPTLTNNFFNRSILKPRIAMLFKDRSKKTTLTSFGLLLPVLALVVACQSSSNDDSAQDDTATNTTIELSQDPNTSDESSTPLANSDEQRDIVKDDPDLLFTETEVPPTFKGGMEAFYQYVADNYNYPEAAVENGVKGRMILQFVVEKDGSLTNIEVLRDLKYGTGEEAIRMLKNSPKWEPAIQNGRPVRIQFTLPIQLNLAAGAESADEKTTNNS